MGNGGGLRAASGQYRDLGSFSWTCWRRLWFRPGAASRAEPISIRARKLRRGQAVQVSLQSLSRTH